MPPYPYPDDDTILRIASGADDPVRATDICAKAAELVGGERERTHGPKLKNHTNTAILTEALMQIRDSDRPIGPIDVCAINILQKLSRIYSGAYNPDDWVDIAGWAGCGGEIAAQLNAEATPSPAAGPPCQKCGKPLDPRRNRWWLGTKPIHYECLNNPAGVPPDADATARRS